VRHLLAVAVLGAVLAGAGAAHADEAEGKRHWKAGQDLYQQKRFLEAAREFEAGYAVAPRPLFLMNIGHAYRRANELAKAKSAYEALLRLQPDLPQRKEVEQYIKTIDDALQANETTLPEPAPRPAPAPVPERTVEVSPVRSLPPPAVSVPEETMLPPYVEARDTAPEPEVSVFRKPWFWVVTGAIIAGGVAVAVIASRPSQSCPGTLCIRE
jgi:tetratricopeptide (TPR) repeat protein